MKKAKLLYIYYLSPFLLISIACCQLYLSTFKNLTAWKGAGFGMFSDVAYRFIEIKINNKHDTLSCNPPKDCILLLRKIDKMPTPYLMKALRNKLIEKKWFLTPTYSKTNKFTYKAFSYDTYIDPPTKISVESAKIKLWSITFNSQSMLVRPKLICKY